MAVLQGSPKTVISVEDKSIIQTTPISGIVIVQGITNRGEVGGVKFIGNPLQFRRKMGGKRSDDPFSIYCLRMLEAGVKLWVIRAGHYTDIDDEDTVEGTKATDNNEVAVTSGSTWTAKDVGPGYNGSTVTITAAVSGTANKLDILIALNESDISVTLLDVEDAPDAAGIIAINKKLDAKEAGVQLTSIDTIMDAVVLTLAGGVQSIAGIVTADWNGSVSGKNGWHAADGVVDAFRIANIGVEDEDVDVGLAAYTVARGDMRFHIGTPLGVNAVGMEAYRDGTAPYSITPHNTYFGTLVAGDVNITDAELDQTFDIPGLVDYLGLQARKDVRQGNWFSAAGPKRGIVSSPNNGVPYNLLSGALAADYDRIYPKGVNAMGFDKDYGTIYWGNKSLYKDQTSLLNRENVADLLVYIQRELSPLVKAVSFDPNDPIMWKEMYRRVRPFISFLESNRAIVAGEDKNWFWQGDQFISNRQDAEFNDLADLDAGKYRARFVFIPIAATEFIGIEVVPTDSGSVQFVISEPSTL